MRSHAAVTVHRSRAEVERLWRGSEHRTSYLEDAGATVRFEDAPGDRGTEIHVDLVRSGRFGKVAAKLAGGASLARVKDELRRFKQQVETGEVPRSDGTPEGERVDRKLKQRPAQPLGDAELERAGAR
jgi:uncharacterized membrane protein